MGPALPHHPIKDWDQLSGIHPSRASFPMLPRLGWGGSVVLSAAGGHATRVHFTVLPRQSAGQLSQVLQPARGTCLSFLTVSLSDAEGLSGKL